MLIVWRTKTSVEKYSFSATNFSQMAKPNMKEHHNRNKIIICTTFCLRWYASVCLLMANSFVFLINNRLEIFGSIYSMHAGVYMEVYMILTCTHMNNITETKISEAETIQYWKYRKCLARQKYNLFYNQWYFYYFSPSRKGTVLTEA